MPDAGPSRYGTEIQTETLPRAANAGEPIGGASSWRMPPIVPRHLVAVCWRAVFMVAVGKHLHPWAFRRRLRGLEDTADHVAVGRHVTVIGRIVATLRRA